MELSKVENTKSTAGIEILRLKNSGRRCVFYSDEICAAPKIRFRICRSCYRISPRFAIRNLYEKIKALALQIFNLQGK